MVQYTVPLVCDVREKPDIAELYRGVSTRGFPLPGNPTLRGQGTLRLRTADPRVSLPGIAKRQGSLLSFGCS